jgi:DNA-directed RNA polymerase alpha subunit
MDLKRVRNLGPVCYEEIIELCKQYGISLKGAKEE